LRTVRRDRSGGFIEKINDIDKAPQFQNWKTINAQAW